MSEITDRINSLLAWDQLFTAEELAWRDTAAVVGTRELKPYIDADFESSHLRVEAIPALGAAGLLGMHIVGYGCAGAGPVAYGLACMEMERIDSSWRTFVSVQGSLAMGAIAKFGSEEQKQTYLPGMARGDLIGCFALTEPSGGSDPAGMTTRADRVGDEWVLTGQKRWIGLASIASVAVVWAKTDEGIRAFLVDTSLTGFAANPILGKLSMRASIQCDIALDGVRLPADAVLPNGNGLSSALSCLNEARYGIVWGVLGAAHACLEAAVERSVDREVFGAPIGARQLTQLKLADTFVEYEKALLLALHLGRLKEAGRLSPEHISVGKLNNVRESQRIARTARSILGGDGITSEFPVMRHMSNLESVQTYEGTDEVHTLVIGRALTALAAFA